MIGFILSLCGCFLQSRIIIKETIYAAIREGKFTTKDIIEFLKNHSWAGKTLLKQTGDKREVPYTWISVLAPSLEEYISQMNLYFDGKLGIINCVLCGSVETLFTEGEPDSQTVLT